MSPRIDGSTWYGLIDHEHERDLEDAAQEAQLREYLATPAGMAALAQGRLDEWLRLNGWDDDEGLEQDGD